MIETSQLPRPTLHYSRASKIVRAGAQARRTANIKAWAHHLETGQIDMKSLYHQLGSLTAVKNLAYEFYDVMENDPYAKDLRDLHPEKMLSTRNNLYKFLSQWLGGPKLFGDQLVNVKWLELKHRRFDLSGDNAEKWLYCMNKAMTNLELKGELKNSLNSKFESLIKSMQIQRTKITSQSN